MRKRNGLAHLQLAWFAGVAIMLGAAPAQAQHDTDQVPPELAPWIPWVLADQAEQACARISDQPVCQWPGVLELTVARGGAEFELSVDMDAPAYRRIVGDTSIWPEGVRVDGRPIPVLNVEDHPVVWLGTGHHLVKGTLSWAEIPETLEIGHDVGLVHLARANEPASLVKRDGPRLWLRGDQSQENAGSDEEETELSVFRRIIDGTPLTVETRLHLKVSGRPRELNISAPQLTGTLPLSVSSDLALSLAADGNLRLQLAAGQHEVRLLARQTEANSPLENRPRPAPWPKEEVWTFQPDAELRSVDLQGLSAIDPSRTELPSEWRESGAYLAQATTRLTLRSTRRGEESSPQNRLHLRREFWLDTGAAGLTVRDHLTGELRQGWRLDLLSGELGAAKVNGVPQVITTREERRGVELRETALDLTATSRLPRSKTMAAVGWSEDVESLSATLHLPPGWRVLFARGVDQASRTWIAEWDLFATFYLLVVSLSLWRLGGPIAGITAVLALVLTRGEVGAPEYVWLPLIALVALLRLVRAGRLERGLSLGFGALVLFAVLSLVGFSVDQVRAALYPHLNEGTTATSDFDDFAAPSKASRGAGMPPAPDAKTSESMPEEQALEEGLPAREATAEAQPAPASPPPPPPFAQRRLPLSSLSPGKRSYSSLADAPASSAATQTLNQLPPDAVVQTGPGIPQTNGPSIDLVWNGPVTAAHRMDLYLVSPNQNRLLTTVRLVALWLLCGLIFRLRTTARRRPHLRPPAGAMASALLACALLLNASPTRAAEPSEERLEQLKARLTRPPPCAPHCVSVTSLSIQLDGTLQIRAEVHAGARAVYELPSPIALLAQLTVMLDGKPASALRLGDTGSLSLRLEPGVHEIRLTARPTQERFTLDLGSPPQRVAVESEAWTVTGIDGQGHVPGGTITFQHNARLDQMRDGALPATTRTQVPPFFHVERRISLGVSSTVTTTIRRLSDASTPEELRLPLLAGEHPTTAEFEVKADAVQVGFPREVTERTILSTLSLPDGDAPITMTLTAPPQLQRTETWQIECGVVLRCATAGVVPTAQSQAGHASWLIRPFPGEVLTLSATRPAVAEGATVTVHQATLTLSPGVRSSQASLEMAIESSRAVMHVITIPATAKLASVKVGGTTQPVQAEAGVVRIALPAGTSHLVVEWRDPAGMSTVFKPPVVQAGAPGVNFRTVVDLPPERWLLAAGGPPQGPALLFWGYLLLILIAAALLPRLPYAPLRQKDWLLLGLGLTQVPAAAAVFLAGWFFAIGSRPRWASLGALRRNLLQLSLVAYTLTFLIGLGVAVYSGLISSPDMEVQGAGSYGTHLVWYQDRSNGALPDAWLASTNAWVWRAFMLAWSLWLSWALLSWLRWAWQAASEGGFWKSHAKGAVLPNPTADVRSASNAPGPERPDGGTDKETTT